MEYHFSVKEVLEIAELVSVLAKAPRQTEIRIDLLVERTGKMVRARCAAGYLWEPRRPAARRLRKICVKGDESLHDPAALPFTMDVADQGESRQSARTWLGAQEPARRAIATCDDGAVWRDAPIRSRELYSICPVSLGRMLCLSFHRGGDDEAFAGREQAIADVVQELAALADVTTGIDALAPRQRQIVAGLWEGLSEKQVASQLQLSLNTVHDYVKTIYRRLDVTTRTELISRMR